MNSLTRVRSQVRTLVRATSFAFASFVVERLCASMSAVKETHRLFGVVGISVGYGRYGLIAVGIEACFVLCVAADW